MSIFKNEITIDTRLGKVTVSSLINAENLSEECISLEKTNFDPKLPTGMSVLKCVAIILQIKGIVELEILQLTVSIDTNISGSSCTGQYLDAQEWSDRGNMVVIGTEDSEGLLERIPKLRNENIELVDFTNKSMTLKLINLPELRQPSFHFIVVENSDPEPVESSAWFAVDQDHYSLLNIKS